MKVASISTLLWKICYTNEITCEGIDRKKLIPKLVFHSLVFSD